MLRRNSRSLLGISRPEHLELSRRTTLAQQEASRSNPAGGKGSGSHPRHWRNLLP